MPRDPTITLRAEILMAQSSLSQQRLLCPGHNSPSGDVYGPAQIAPHLWAPQVGWIVSLVGQCHCLADPKKEADLRGARGQDVPFLRTPNILK